MNKLTPKEESIVKKYNENFSDQTDFMNDGFCYLTKDGLPNISKLNENDLFQFNKNLYKFSLDVSGGIPDSLLEVGCGKGGGLRYLEDLKISKLYGVDINEKHINHCKKHLSRATVKLARATNLPFEDNQFEVVLSIESVGYYDSLNSFIEESYRVLRKTGRLIISFLHNEMTPFSLENIIKSFTRVGFINVEVLDLTKSVRIGIALQKGVIENVDSTTLNALINDEKYLLKGHRYYCLHFRK